MNNIFNLNLNKYEEYNSSRRSLISFSQGYTVNNLLFHTERTGLASRFISHINIYIFIYLIVYFVKDQQYWPSVILFIASFTGFGILASIGILIYFAISKYWIGIIFLLLYEITFWLSLWFGYRNVNKILLSIKANVDPLEKMTKLTVITVLEIIFFLLAVTTSGIISIIFWILFGLTFLLEMRHCFHRIKSPWRRIHFPLMVRYYEIDSILKMKELFTKTKVENEHTLYRLAKSAYPNLDLFEIQKLFYSALKNADNFSDREQLTEIFKRKNPKMNLIELKILLDDIYKNLYSNDKDIFKLKYLIAEIVRRDFGDEERLKYLYAVYTGEAF